MRMCTTFNEFLIRMSKLPCVLCPYTLALWPGHTVAYKRNVRVAYENS